jgi:hypothetical protein
MNKTSRRFTKGQTIFYASTYFRCPGRGDRDHADVYLGAVIERQVDACGAKQVTFFDRAGFDGVFCRSDRAEAEYFFATPDEAFQYLRNHGAVDVISPDIHSDADPEIFSRPLNVAAK